MMSSPMVPIRIRRINLRLATPWRGTSIIPKQDRAARQPQRPGSQDVDSAGCYESAGAAGFVRQREAGVRIRTRPGAGTALHLSDRPPDYHLPGTMPLSYFAVDFEGRGG